MAIGGDASATADGLARVSVSSGGVQATDGGSVVPAISADGRYVAFDSGATNLVVGDVNAKRDVFVHDRSTGITTRVSVTTAGGAGNDDSISPAISADGRYVAFLSRATNLVPGDTNGLADVFVRDRQSAQTTRVNVGPAGIQADADTWPDGDVFWHTRGGLSNTQIAMSGDGRYVAFVSRASTLAAAPAGTVPTDVCVRDRQLDLTSCIRTPLSAGNEPSVVRPSVAISSDGRIVAFATSGRHVAGDTNQRRDVYVHDRTTVETTRVSVSSAGQQGDGASGWPSLSADGRVVAFASDARNLIANETNGPRFVYLHDRQSATTTRISAYRALQPAISGDGRFVSYAIYGRVEVFDNQTGVTHIVTAGPAGVANGFSFGPVLSADGKAVAFASAATDLIAGDTNGQDDVFVVANAPPTIGVDRTSLRFAAVTTPTGFASQTGTQQLRLTKGGVGIASWTTTSSDPWLVVSPTAGAGSAVLHVSVRHAGVLPPSGVRSRASFV